MVAAFCQPKIENEGERSAWTFPSTAELQKDAEYCFLPKGRFVCGRNQTNAGVVLDLLSFEHKHLSTFPAR